MAAELNRAIHHTDPSGMVAKPELIDAERLHRPETPGAVPPFVAAYRQLWNVR